MRKKLTPSLDPVLFGHWSLPQGQGKMALGLPLLLTYFSLLSKFNVLSIRIFYSMN